jgi:hypothetical protein
MEAGREKGENLKDKEQLKIKKINRVKRVKEMQKGLKIKLKKCSQGVKSGVSREGKNIIFQRGRRIWCKVTYLCDTVIFTFKKNVSHTVLDQKSNSENIL